jgi:creatinine amidohydrolase
MNASEEAVNMKKAMMLLMLSALVMIGTQQSLLAQPKGEAAGAAKAPAPTTREMSLLCWQEFGEFVPGRIRTVLVPFGSLEPHGVVPNGTDSLSPEAMARDIAERVDALIAPTLNYGMTDAMKAFPGSISIPAEAYAPFAEAVLDNLAANGFRNLIVLNGHGGNTTALNTVATRVANRNRVRVLVVNWWTLADDITKSVFKENGGHAGNNETAYIQAIVPAHIHPERYKPAMASPIAPTGAYYAVPVASTILLYEKGQGYPTFDPAQAKEYFRKVNDRVAELVLDTIKKWDLAGVYK